MYLKKKLLKAASVCSYAFTALWFVVAACFFALSDALYWMFAVFALVSLYSGFVVTSVREKAESVTLAKKENIKLLVCWILSIVCPPAFVLNGLAYFRNKEDEIVTVRRNVEAEASAQEEPALNVSQKPKTNKVKAFCKKKSFITTCVSLGLIFIFGFCGMLFETSGFSVEVKDFTLTREMTEKYGKEEDFVITDEAEYSATMYKPKTATEENPAAVVFVLPGFTRTKATMAQYCIELSRRGFVVFCMDPGAQGGTTAPVKDEDNYSSTKGANGVEYLVQYVYNNTDDYNFCDKTRFGAVGHSAGGGNVCTLASDMAGKNYEESIIKSVYISGYIKSSSIAKYKDLRCNAAMSYAYYDEGAFRYRTDADEPLEVAGLKFINNVNGENTNSYSELSYDYGYGDMSDGTYRVVHRENTNHCFEMYDKTSIANTVKFFDESLDMNSGLDGFSQVWFGKEFFNGLALASAFTFVIALCAVLMNIPFFATIKNSKKKAAANADTEPAMVQVEGAKPAVISGRAHKTVAHKVIFWSCIILTAIIACLDYIPLANLSIEIFPVHNKANVFTFMFPARMVNAILLWAAINGAIGLVIFFGTTLLENLYEYSVYKIKGVQPEYDWNKFKAIKIGGNKWYNVLFNVLKAILLALICFGAFYFLVQISYWCFHQDFRFMLISAAPLNARMFVTALEYMPIIFVFYISNSIRVNCSIGREGWKEWKVMLVSALANSVGLAFILLINYVCYFTTGTPFYGYWGANNNEVWLFINMVFGLVVMMFILPIFNRLFYKITGNVWTGAIACCMIFVMMTISASVSYIPM
ncbi:MAG: alpha/beta hydrolase [Clostridia bacterium]|nr:alpha/beta hydrolase [Clostridia bacterium]